MNINFRSQRLIPGYDFLQTQPDNKPVKVLVHEFIQSVVFTPFPQDGELQVERLTLAGNIYESIGFKRKAAFYRRFAALKSVTVQPNWQACYDSLIGSMNDFGLTLDPIDYEKSLTDRCSSVWPSLHIQLIEELITCCKKIQNPQSGTLAIRHMSFMLHTLDFHLSSTKKKEFARELEELSTQFGEDSPVPLRLGSGFIVPTVNLTKYPLCLKLEPVPLPMPLRPVRLTHLKPRLSLTPTIEEKSNNPFIFTPITNHNSLSIVESRRTSSNALITDVTWVQDEPCHTTMVLKNTLPFELKVTSINLLSDGVPLEMKPYSICLAPDSNTSTSIQLIGIPRQSLKSSDDSDVPPPKIEIFGYSTHLLGVKSNCRLDMIPRSKFPSRYIVSISPPLPRIEFQFPDGLPDVFVDPIPADQVEKDLVILEFGATIEINQRIETQLTILNSSNVDLEYMYICEAQQRKSEKRIVRWSDQVVEGLSSNPLRAGEKINVPIWIEAPEELFKSIKSESTVLMFEYSGGVALKEMFGRKCSIRLTVDITEKEVQQVDAPAVETLD